MTNRPEYPTPEVCSKCGDNTAFEYDELEGWVSVCCTARPYDPAALADGRPDAS